jgi:hypothetical protein
MDAVVWQLGGLHGVVPPWGVHCDVVSLCAQAHVLEQTPAAADRHHPGARSETRQAYYQLRIAGPQRAGQAVNRGLQPCVPLRLLCLACSSRSSSS